MDTEMYAELLRGMAERGDFASIAHTFKEMDDAKMPFTPG
jgi:pentatricopeptide repeat protein